MNDNTPNIDELKTHVKNLLALLDDPEPGLFSWHGMVHERLKHIADFSGVGCKGERRSKSAENKVTHLKKVNKIFWHALNEIEAHGCKHDTSPTMFAGPRGFGWPTKKWYEWCRDMDDVARKALSKARKT